MFKLEGVDWGGGVTLIYFKTRAKKNVLSDDTVLCFISNYFTVIIPRDDTWHTSSVSTAVSQPAVSSPAFQSYNNAHSQVSVE